MEVAARLEYMAEARGRPRPGQPHPDAEVEDPDGALCGPAPIMLALARRGAAVPTDHSFVGKGVARLGPLSLSHDAA